MGWRQNTVQEWSRVRFLNACERTPRKQGKNLVTSVSLKHENILRMCF